MFINAKHIKKCLFLDRRFLRKKKSCLKWIIPITVLCCLLLLFCSFVIPLPPHGDYHFTGLAYEGIGYLQFKDGKVNMIIEEDGEVIEVRDMGTYYRKPDEKKWFIKSSTWKKGEVAEEFELDTTFWRMCIIGGTMEGYEEIKYPRLWYYRIIYKLGNLKDSFLY